MLSICKYDLNKISHNTLTDKCIILDLDETLVHTFDDFNTYFNLPNDIGLKNRTYALELDDVFDKNGSGVITNIWGVVRPYTKEFLIMCFDYFKIVAVWSAGQKKYVNGIVNFLFKDLKRPHVIFSYEHCEPVEESFNKPLQKMIDIVPGLDKYMSLNNTYILDDRKANFDTVNNDNGILIPAYKPYFNIYSLNKVDIHLNQFMIWLERNDVINCSDIRKLDKSDIFNSN